MLLCFCFLTGGAIGARGESTPILFSGEGRVVSCVPVNLPQASMVARMRADAVLLENSQGQQLTSERQRQVWTDASGKQQERYQSSMKAVAAGHALGCVLSQWEDAGKLCLEVEDSLKQ